MTVGLRVADRVRPRVQEIPVRLPGRGPFVRTRRLFHHQLEDAVLPSGVADGRAAGQLHVRVPRLPVIPHRSVARTLLTLGQSGILPGVFHHLRHVEVDRLVVEPPFLLPVGEGHHQTVGTAARLPVGVYDAFQLVLRHALLPREEGRHIRAGHHLTGEVQLEVGELAALIQHSPLVGLHRIEKIQGALVRDHLLYLDLHFLRRYGLLLMLFRLLLLRDHRNLVFVADDGLTGGKDIAP